MLFSVVVTIDAPPPMRRYLPRKSLRKRLNGGYTKSEYDYLAEQGLEDWNKARQWMGSGILTRVEFEALVEDLGVYASKTQTMGTLGGPLDPIGWVPDVSFENSWDGSIVCMRATPILEHASNFCANAEEATRKWDRLEAAMWRQYECGRASHFTMVPMQARERWQRRFPFFGDVYAKAVQRARKESRRLLNF